MKRPQTIESAKQNVARLLGKKVLVRMNRGRNRIRHYSGMLSEVHSNVFVITVEDSKVVDRLSCSYAEVLCGEIRLKEYQSR